MIRLLLDAGADSDASATIGWRPIHRFAEYGNVDGLRAILAATSRSVDVRDDEDDSTALTCGGETVADLAAKHGHDAIVSLLRT